MLLLSQNPFALLAGAGVFVILLVIAIAALMIISNWIINIKAGRPGWAAIIPVYSQIVTLQVAKLSPWLIFIYLAGIIPFVGSLAVLAFTIFVTVKVGLAFGKSGGFIVGMILLPIVFYPILAFGNSKYINDNVEEIDVTITEA